MLSLYLPSNEYRQISICARVGGKRGCRFRITNIISCYRRRLYQFTNSRWHRDQSLGYWLSTFVFVSSVCSSYLRYARFTVLALIENISFKTGTDTYKFLNTVHFPKACFECFEKQRLQCLFVVWPLVMKPVRRNLRSVHPVKSPDWEEVANVFVSAVGNDHSVDPYWLRMS